MLLLAAVAVSYQRTHPAAPPPGELLAVGEDPYATGDAVHPGEIAPPRESASRETWEALLPRLRQAAEADPADAAAQRRLALAYYNLGRLNDAVALYRRLLEKGEDAVVRNRLGNALRDQGDLTGAERAYRQAMATDPTLPAPYANLAELLWRRHRHDEALALLAAGLEKVTPGARPALERVRDALEKTAMPGGPTASTPGT